MGKYFKFGFSSFFGCLGIWVFGFLVVLAEASPLDDQLAAYKKAPTQTEAAVANILKTGIQEGRAAEAVAAVKPWLNDNQAESPAAQYYAGLAMEYSGDGAGAVSFYRKFLKNKTLDSGLAGSVVTAIYSLLLNDMGQAETAYLLMREDGNRLRAYGKARQYDGWFLDEAKRRNDVPAVCGRMEAIFSTAPSNTVPDTADLEWICAKLETFTIPDETWMPAALKLAAVPQVPEKYRARINWVNEIVPFTKEATELFRANKPIPDALFDKPLKAAEALVAALPYDGSILAARGWMNIREGHTPNLFRYVSARRDAKAAPIIKALARLPVQQAQAVLSAPGCPQGRPVSGMFYAETNYATAELKTLIKSLPAVFNSLASPDIAMFDATLTVDDAKALSPLLVRNPGGQAALVRAYAVAGTNTVSAMAPALMKSELWRFESAKQAIDMLWNSGAKRDGADNGALVKQYQDLGARNAQLSKQVGKEASSQDRMAALTAICQELQGGNYSTPGLLKLWDELFKQAPPADNEKILQKLVSDFTAAPPAAVEMPKYFLEQAMAKIQFGNGYSRLTFGPEFAGGWDQWGHGNVRKALPGLAADLGKLLRQQMAAGTISEPVFGMWLHCADPGQPEAKALFEELVKSAAYGRMKPAYHNMAANRLLFGRLAMTPAMLANEPETVSRELLALPADAQPAAVEAAFKTVIERVAQSPVPVPVYGLHKVAALPVMSAETRANAMLLFKQLAPIGNYPGGQGYEQLVLRLVKEMEDAKQWGALVPYAAALWRTCHTPDDLRSPKAADALTSFAEAAVTAGNSSVAYSVAQIGLKSGIDGLSLNGQHNPVASQARRGRLSAVSGKAAVALGAVEIPVDETDPSYGIHKSCAEYVQGNPDSAWKLYVDNSERMLIKIEGSEKPLIQQFPAEYGFWLLNRNIAEGRSADAEALVKELTIWSRAAEGTFSPQQEADLKIAYADLAFTKGALPTARAWYRKVAEAAEYKGTEIHLRAALGSVKVDRVTKNFGAALDELDKLILIPAPSARVMVHYARAEVLMDQENFKDALDEIAAVLRGDVNHEDALILRGKVQYRMRKLVEASEIELGVSQEHKVMVPGETLKINLNDPTLSVSGVGADIEVEVTAKSGDRETVLLHQLGDSKDKFRADVATALAPPVAGDKVLQVLGVDEIRYGYSQRFRAKMKDLPPDLGTVISIASDAHLSLSAGAFPPREGERKLDIEELGLSTAQQRLGLRSVRPGNPVYIRVIDPDQSRTAGTDEIPVALQTSSGDEIRRFMLKETGPYTGEFEGVVPTAGAQAMAFASESAPGRDPNMAISAKDYPGWLGNVGNKEKMRTFGVDFNDSVPIDRMSINFGEPGNGLTHFVLQTSMNGRDWVTRARYPNNTAPWDGRPRVSSFPTYRGGIGVSVPEGRELPADWNEHMELNSARASCSYLAATVTNLAAGVLQMVETGHPDYSGLMQYRAMFYQPDTAVRRFSLAGCPEGQTLFLLDGQPADEETADPLMIERELAPGLHEIQVWFHGSRGKITASKPVLSCDVKGKADMVPCPDGMFDPATFPEGVRAGVAAPAGIAKTADGSALDVSFGTNTQARLVRLVILGFEGVAPAIKSVKVADREGSAIFPVKEDFMALRQNVQLEVLPGDQIVARYDDPVTATPGRSKHEQRLQVAFNTATISASFLNYEQTAEGRVLKLEPIRRFKFGDAIAIVVDDADMDSSSKPDTIDCKVTVSDGQAITIKAVETENQSGSFIGRVFPVQGKPARESEIMLPAGGTLTAVYRDTENLDPGIPADRTVTIEHAKYSVPALEAYDVSSEVLPVVVSAVEAGAAKGRQTGSRVVSEVFEARRRLDYSHKDEAAAAAAGLKAVIGASLRFDVVVPHLALAGSSEISAYVQTGAGRSKAVKPDGAQAAPYDITVPGTFKLTASPSRAGAVAPQGYSLGASPVPPNGVSPLEEGRFSFSVPLILGDVPDRSFATKDAESLPSSSMPEGVAVRAGDIVHAGFAYRDEKDQVQWKTVSFTVESHAFLDVMQDGYGEPLTNAFVGEKLFLRVLAPGLDAGSDRDSVSVMLKASSGAQSEFQLRETEVHTGIFKGVFPLSYADEVLPAELPSIELNGLPVRYGDEVAVSYGDLSHAVKVNKGADGIISPFSKRFTGDEMAVKTSFTLAECWFELAKKHKEMDQESLARREMGQAQKLLAEAIAMHRDDEMRAHAEYLLGNLSQEYADLAKNDESKLPLYQDALARFSKIPVDYPDTEFAPKAQFKTALVYEKMGEMEIAVEEYVKLAYKYPDCEYIPEVMSRLGGYFQSKGQAFKELADAIRAKTDVESQGEVIRLDELSYPEFVKAAVIFAKLPARFPDHALAGMSGLRSAQNYMRANQYIKAIDGFKAVIDNESYDGGEIRSQALYWCGLSYERHAAGLSEADYRSRGDAIQEAYELYRRTTFDFPDSKWAKLSRGRLADPVFGRIVEEEEKARVMMLEMLKTEKNRKR